MNNFSKTELLAYKGLNLDEFISRKDVHKLVNNLNKKYPQYKNHKELMNKSELLAKFTKLGLVCRKYWTYPHKPTDNSIYIVKPNNDSWGRGVRLIFPPYEYYPNQIIEERIRATYELWKYNISSLNTIRVITIRFADNVEIFAAQFRCGVGNKVTDNAHTGGLFASIDIDSGVVNSNFVNVKGDEFEKHPITKLKVKGLQIPLWNEIVEKSKIAALHTDNIISGWDIAVTKDNKVEFIEGNSIPDFDMVQIPNKIGVKNKLLNCLNKQIIGNNNDFLFE